MENDEQFEVTPHIEGTRSWPALAASAVLHTIIILLLLFGLPRNSNPAPRQSEDQSQPIALPPPLPAVTKNNKPLPTPKPKETVLGPDAKKPSNDPKELGPPKPITEPTPDKPKQEDPAPNPPAPEPPKPDAANSTTPQRIPRAGEDNPKSVFRPDPLSPFGTPGS